MKKFLFPVLCIAAAMLSADDKLPVDEDISLSRIFDFSCDRHKAKEAELLQPPAGEYAFPKNEIIWEDGQPILYSGGVRTSLFAGQLMSRTNGNPLSARQLRQAGVNLFLVDVNYVHSKNIYVRSNPRSADPNKTYAAFAQNAGALLKSVPDARIIIRIWASYEGDDYKKLYPDALLAEPSGNTVWKNGEQRANYLTEWKLYLAEKIRAFLEKVGSSRFAPHVAGVYVGAMNTGEWWYWKDGKFYWDYSKTRQEAFKNYLIQKYGEDGLKKVKARYKAKDEEDLYRLPTRKERTGAILPNTRVADYYQVLNLPVTNAARYIAQVVKAVSGGKLLAGVEFLTDLHVMNVNGSVFMNQLVDCPEMDFFGAPSPYSLRYPGGFSPHRAADASLKHHRKMFFAEDDFRTFTSYGTPAGRAGCPASTPLLSANSLRRQGCEAILRGHNSYLMEFGGRWFTHPDILTEIARMNRFRDVVGLFKPVRKSEIAVVSDQESQLYGNYFATPIELRQNSLPSIGADHDFFELRDLLDPEVFRNYKLIIFLNICALGERERQGIEKMKSDGRTLLFLYNPGAVNLTYNRFYDLSDAGRLTSFKLKYQKAKSTWGKVKLKANTENLRRVLSLSEQELELGSLRKVSPGELAPVDHSTIAAGTNLIGWAIDDPDAVPLGASSDGGIRFAVKNHPNWTAYYSTSCSLPTKIVRSIARKAGCHIVNLQGDVVFSRGDFISVHAAFKGKHLLHFPSGDKVLECVTGKEYELKNQRLEMECNRGDTMLFYCGPQIAEVKKALAEYEKRQAEEIAVFRKNNPSPLASPGWIHHSRTNRRPVRSGPFKFSAFVAPAMLVAGPFRDFDETVAAMSGLPEIRRMVKEPPPPELSMKLDTLNDLVKTAPPADPARPLWTAFWCNPWNMLSRHGIGRGQSGFYSFLIQTEKDTELSVLFGTDARAKLLIGGEEFPSKVGTNLRKITVKQGLTRVLLAIENASGTQGFTLKFFCGNRDFAWAEYSAVAPNYNWANGRIFLNPPEAK
ncbi:MAG: hypothetical protein E7055_07025 [Lentisphaerae bacterium]|nr:hypothetical protein [Lentisphaerota bacterium]